MGKKIKTVKKKRQIENLILKILIVAAFIVLAGAVGGFLFYAYLIWNFM